MESFEMNNREKEIVNDVSCSINSSQDSVIKEEIYHHNISSPKKRGRKRKSEQVALNAALDSPAQNENELSTTRSARKRKSVNYFALANPDFDDIVNDEVEEETEVNENNIRAAKIRKTSAVKSEDVMKENQFVETESVKQCLPGSSKNVNPVEIEIVSDIKPERDVLNSVDVEERICSDVQEDQELVTHITKEKAYRRTGSTVHMVNTLLSQADLKKDVSETKNVSGRKFKRGRPSKGQKKIKDEKVDSEDEYNPPDLKTVSCAICNKEMEKNTWVHHKQRYHNNLAWRVGEPPLDLNNMDLVKQILNALYAARKPFYCDKCDKSVKSVNGFLSHKSVCGKTTDDVKVTCNYCTRRMLPISLPSHIRKHHENKDLVEVQVVRKKSTENICSKRPAAEKALKVIQNLHLGIPEISTTYAEYFEELPFISSKLAKMVLEQQIETLSRVQCKYPDCTFECFTTKDMKNHLKFCVQKPKNGYVCKQCLMVTLNIDDIVNHIKSVHNTVVEDGKEEKKKKNNAQNNENDEKITNNMERTQKMWPPFLLPSDRNVDVVYHSAYEWTLKFCETNYKTVIPEDNFPCLKSRWDYMDLTLIEEYLPNMPYSCDVGFETVVDFQSVLHKDHTFRKFEIFESYLENNGNSTIFCGGPISALAWLPTPYDTDNIHQIVAVATKPHPDNHYLTDRNYNEKCLIQFWDVGPLKNSDTSLFRPRQAFCLQFDNGPVWDLQWCPSNCYDLSDQPEDSEKLRRLGVLAVAASDSFVYIYSIPNFKESGQFYNGSPVLKLARNVCEKEKLGNMSYYATKMSWTKNAGHKYLAVGYSNGQVAIYNLIDSNLLRYKTHGNFDIIMPYKVFEAHHHTITAISLHHSHDGCKWLMTGSYDRTVHTWDLEYGRSIHTIKGNIVNDAAWMTNWMCYVIGYDEASTIGNACSVVHQCKEGYSDPLYLFHCSSAITSISTSDWLNGIIQANSVGEIFATFPKQLMMNLNWKNLKNKKLLFGYTTLIEKDKTVEERLKVYSEKEKALRNQLKVKTKITSEELPSDRDVMHLDYNPHYYEYEPLVYHEMDDKYGLIFCDHKMTAWSDFPPQLKKHMSHNSEKYSPSRPNMYSLQSITKIQFNMNRQASTYYISGYQAGFIRLTYMKFLRNDPYVAADSEKLKKTI